MRCPRPVTLLCLTTVLLFAGALTTALTPPVVVEAAAPVPAEDGAACPTRQR